MTPAQVQTAALRRYNSEQSTFWGQDEIFKVISEAEMALATECLNIEGVDTSISTVIGTRQYSLPSSPAVLALKRVEYDGRRLVKIDVNSDDELTLYNANTTSQGTPQWYAEWDGAIYLRPIPAAVATITLYTYEEPALLTTASTTLSVPVRCHLAMVEYVTAQMAFKDENYPAFDRMINRWEKFVEKEKAFAKKKKRTDSFATVKTDEGFGVRFPGPV